MHNEQVPGPQRHPLLLEAESWAAEHLDLLVVCFEGFQRDGEWPTLELLQHDFELAGRDADVSQLAWQMPRLLGFAEQGRLVLLVRGLSHVPGAAPLLEDWCRVLIFTYERWREDPAAELTRGDVFRLLEGDSARTRAVSLLLQRESWPFGSGHGGPEDEWSREIISHVRAVRNAHSAADILAARDAIEHPPPLPNDEIVASEEEPPAQRRHRIEKVWRLFSENALLASLISGAILLVIGYYVFHSTSESSGTSSGGVVGGHGSHQDKVGRSGSLPAPQGQRWREQAGTGGARTFTRPSRCIRRAPGDVEPLRRGAVQGL
jgi:hypothetical protein